LAAFDKAVWKTSRCVQGAPGGSISGDERRREVLCAGLGSRRGGCRRLFWGKFMATVPPRDNITVGVAADVPGGVHLGKTGSVFILRCQHRQRPFPSSADQRRARP
jgi:hypothetical protein